MSDTNDLRRDFEVFVAERYGFGTSDFARDADSDTYVSVDLENEWEFWQAATERAAQVVEAMTARKRMNSSQKPDCEYAAAIRQGGAHD